MYSDIVSECYLVTPTLSLTDRVQKKAGYIKRVSQILRDKYGGDIPATMDQLVRHTHAPVTGCSAPCSAPCLVWVPRCPT